MLSFKWSCYFTVLFNEKLFPYAISTTTSTVQPTCPVVPLHSWLSPLSTVCLSVSPNNQSATSVQPGSTFDHVQSSSASQQDANAENLPFDTLIGPATAIQ